MNRFYWNHNYTPTTKWGGGAILDSLCSVGRSVRPSVSNSCPLYSSFTNGRISFKLLTHSPQLRDVQSPCCPCVSSRSRSKLKVKYLTNKYDTLCRVRSITPLLMEGFPSNLNDTFTSTRGCAEPMLSMCQLKVKVTLKCQINQNKIYIHLKPL